MPFILEKAVPWGRTLREYRRMFALTDTDLTKRIAGFGDGPASFNAEAHQAGVSVVSFDPIYRYSKEQIAARMQETTALVLQQTRQNMDHYIWDEIKDLEQLKRLRLSAMHTFLADYERGREEGRYRCHALPAALPDPDGYFDLGLCSHFLFLYTSLGYDFHMAAISEMLRVCREVRIFPLLDLNSRPSDLARNTIHALEGSYRVSCVPVPYEFQKGGNQMLRICKP